ncbi:SCP2 sterol-binding domain-containing protein [Paenibacillus sp.]|jgi:putative sterol carrier protein|uniref:SCP2 sterol-binding domain-containing protein n=1 Tax=Paenibacillus sp. TaxID=58172 RepID=UPI002822E8AB|nr:SCP2 sterol-binding domain-containing protein [Paenibacillus sp.]MDR0267422.1 SCP2 sterol-binding domain-containing protein [Paenibacillus sp.]
MSIKEELHQLVDLMNANPKAIESVHAVYRFNLGENGMYQVVFENGGATVSEEPADNADCTLTLSEKNFRKLLEDDLNTTMAFMTGSLKVDGKIGLALKLQEILKQYR